MITLHFTSPHEISVYAKFLPEEERDKILIVEKDSNRYFITHWDGRHFELNEAEFDHLTEELNENDIRMLFLISPSKEAAYKKPHLTESGHLKELRGYCEKIDTATKELQEKSGPDGVRFYEQVLENLDEIIAFFISFEIESDAVVEALNEALTELNERGAPASPLFN